MLSEQSKYSIIVSQDSTFTTSSSLSAGIIIIILFSSLAFIFIIILLVALIYWAIIKQKNRIEEIERYQQRVTLVSQNKQRIDSTLQGMAQGTFSNITNHYKLESWIICLEEFNSMSIVSMTNECKHIFHTFWLKNWYENTRVESPLKWPFCCTINLPAPFRPENTAADFNNNTLAHSRMNLERSNENRVVPIFIENGFL